MTGGGDGMFNGNGMGFWGFLILAMFLFGGGNWGNNRGPAPIISAPQPQNYATSAEVQRGFDNQNAMANQREILSAVNAGTAQSVASTNQVFHDTVNALSDKYTELQRDIGALSVGQANSLANQNQCRASMQMALADGFAQTNANIAQNKYDAAMNTASINATTTAQTQKILDALAQNKIESLQGQVSQLQLQNAMAGVVRYPSALTFGAGPSPFCGCGNGCNGYPLYS